MRVGVREHVEDRGWARVDLRLWRGAAYPPETKRLGILAIGVETLGGSNNGLPLSSLCNEFGLDYAEEDDAERRIAHAPFDVVKFGGQQSRVSTLEPEDDHAGSVLRQHALGSHTVDAMTRSIESWASSEATRASMRANKGRDTKPELALRRAVHAMGLRYRVSFRPLRSVRRTADLVFTRAKVAVFMDGCFWHGCPIHHTVAATNAGFWAEKVRRTRERDAETDRVLREAGWHVLRVWEHENPTEAAIRVANTVELHRRLRSHSQSDTR